MPGVNLYGDASSSWWLTLLVIVVVECHSSSWWYDEFCACPVFVWFVACSCRRW